MRSKVAEVEVDDIAFIDLRAERSDSSCPRSLLSGALPIPGASTITAVAPNTIAPNTVAPNTVHYVWGWGPS